MHDHRRSSERERFWREAVAGHKKSGLSVRAFCADRGLSEPSFYAWRRELARRGRASRTPAATFVPVQVVADSIVEVVLPSGVVVRAPLATDAMAVARLVAALGSPSC
jgi:transposase-like protein